MSETESEETTSTPEPIEGEELEVELTDEEREAQIAREEFERKVAHVKVDELEVPRNRFGLVDWEQVDQSEFTPEQLIALSDDHNKRAEGLSPEELKELDLEVRERRRSTQDSEKYERIRQQAEDVFYGGESPQVKLELLERLLRLHPGHEDILGYMEGVSMEMSGDQPEPIDLDDVSFSDELTEQQAFDETQEDEERLDERDE